MRKLLIVLVHILSVNCAVLLDCPEDGIYPNPDDITTFIECIEGKSHLRLCPKDSDGRDLVFDGQVCTSPEAEPVVSDDDEGDDEEPLLARNGRQTTPRYICPRSHGIFEDPDVRHHYYQCSRGQPIRRYSCPANTDLNKHTMQCVGTAHSDSVPAQVVDEEVNVVARPYYYDHVVKPPRYSNSYVIKRPVRVEVERPPIVRDIAPRVVQYDPPVQYRVGYGRRFRRNARVETEDEYTGDVVVDTWNEDSGQWQRRSHGQRLLPDINGWHRYHYRNRRYYK